MTMDAVFYFVLNMSIGGSVVILLVLALRAVRLFPRRYIYVLWALPFLRLVLPLAPSGPFSLWRLGERFIARVIPAGEIGNLPDIPLGAMNFVGAISTIEPGALPGIPGGVTRFAGAAEAAPISYRTEALAAVFRTAGALWLVVACAALLTAAALYFITSSALKKSEHIGEKLYSNPLVSSPTLFGIFRPKIIFPTREEAESASPLVIAHEDVHIKRLDNLRRPLALAVACVHWFNPLAWVMLRAFYLDMELSCDEAVTSALDRADRGKYAAALLSFAGGGHFILPAAFGKSKVRVRVERVLKYKGLTAASSAALLIFLAAVAVALMTNP